MHRCYDLHGIQGKEGTVLMKKRRIVLLMLLACALSTLGLVGCTEQKSTADTKSSGEITLYFGNADQTDLLAETLKIPENTANVLEYTVDKLLEGPSRSEHQRMIRAGTDVKSITMADGVVTVDFTKEFYNNEAIIDVLAASSVVKTLCGFSDVRRVKILVEGQELVGPNQKPLGELREEDLVFDAGDISGDETTVKLYFADSEAMLGSELRRIKSPQKETLEKTVVQELVKGPQSKELTRTVPPESKILSVETKDGVCFVNLSNEFVAKHWGGTTGEQLTIYSIVNSLTELSHIDKVQFLIEGKRKDVFLHMIFNEPFERDVSIINKSNG